MNKIDEILKLIPETETDFLEDVTNISTALDGNEITEEKAGKELYNLCYIVFPDKDEDLLKWHREVIDAMLVINGLMPYFLE